MAAEDGDEVTRSKMTAGAARAFRWLGVVVIMLAVFTVTQGWYFSRQDREITDCQARFNRDFATILILRNQWAAEDRDALTKLVNTVTTATSRAAGHRALVDYLATVRKNDVLRAQHPLPDLEDRDCTGK